MEHRNEIRMRTAQRIQERSMPSMENFTEQTRLHHESVMRRQMLLAKLQLAKDRANELSGRRKIRTASERGVGGSKMRGGNWWDVFDPNKNGVANAFDPNKNGVAQAVNQAVAAVSNEFTNPNSVLAKGVTDAANKVANEFTNPNSVLNAGTADALRRLDNEFTNPDSVMRRGVENAFDPNKNGVGVAFQQVANEFNNPNSDFRRGVGSAAEVLKSTLEGPVRNFLEQSFDPNKNGLGDAFRKFGKDTEAAFQEFGNKMASAFSKEEMDRAFGPLKDAFEKFGNATDTWFKSVDPMVWIIVASSILTIAGTIASFGLAGPALMGANAALISAAGAAVTIGGKAALGRSIDPTDVAGLVLSLLPVPGVSVAAGQGSNAIFKALSAVGQTAAGMSKAQVALAGAQAINGIAAAQQSLPGGVNLSIGFGKHGRRRGKGMTTDFAEQIANLTKAEILDEVENDAEAELTGGYNPFSMGNYQGPMYEAGLRRVGGASLEDFFAQFGNQYAQQPKSAVMPFDPQPPVYIGGTPDFYNPRPIQDFTPMPQPYDPSFQPRPRPRPVYDGMNYTGGTPYNPNLYGQQEIPMRRGQPYTEYSPTSNAGFGGRKKKGGRKSGMVPPHMRHEGTENDALRQLYDLRGR